MAAGSAGPDLAPLPGFLRGSRWQKTSRCPPTHTHRLSPAGQAGLCTVPAPAQPAWDSRGQNRGLEGRAVPCPAPPFGPGAEGLGGRRGSLREPFRGLASPPHLSGSAPPPHPPLVASKSVGARPLARVAPSGANRAIARRTGRGGGEWKTPPKLPLLGPLPAPGGEVGPRGLPAHAEGPPRSSPAGAPTELAAGRGGGRSRHTSGSPSVGRGRPRAGPGWGPAEGASGTRPVAPGLPRPSTPQPAAGTLEPGRGARSAHGSPCPYLHPWPAAGLPAPGASRRRRARLRFRRRLGFPGAGCAAG